MKMMMEVAAAAALIVGGADVAVAQDFSGARQIAAGDYAGAERAITTQRRLFPRDADLMLNLATVYRRTGRTDEARRLYQAVAAQPDELLDLPDGRTASAHALANEGLRRLTLVATR